jgi:hypothetical protein
MSFLSAFFSHWTYAQNSGGAIHTVVGITGYPVSSLCLFIQDSPHI